MPERLRSRRRPHRPAPTVLLDPILTLWERADRRRRRIRPIRREGVLGLELTRYTGRPVPLADGSVVLPGDRVGEFHLQNRRISELVRFDATLQGWREGWQDLHALAAWAERQPPAARPVAYHGATLLWPLARRARFEIRPRPRTWRTRLDDWFLRWLMIRWGRDGRSRLERGRGRLFSGDVWLSDRSLRSLYGATDSGRSAASVTPPPA
jgi:hypothetical protein